MAAKDPRCKNCRLPINGFSVFCGVECMFEHNKKARMLNKVNNGPVKPSRAFKHKNKDSDIEKDLKTLLRSIKGRKLKNEDNI